MLNDQFVLLGSSYALRLNVINPDIHERVIRLWGTPAFEAVRIGDMGNSCLWGLSIR